MSLEFREKKLSLSIGDRTNLYWRISLPLFGLIIWISCSVQIFRSDVLGKNFLSAITSISFANATLYRSAKLGIIITSTNLSTGATNGAGIAIADLYDSHIEGGICERMQTTLSEHNEWWWIRFEDFFVMHNWWIRMQCNFIGIFDWFWFFFFLGSYRSEE